MNITTRDIQLSELLGPKSITEASLGRIYQHFLRSGEKSWAILSAYRYGLTPEENNNRDKRLRSWLQEKGYGGESKKGYFQVIGKWTEEDPVTGKPALDPSGEKKQASEVAYFVVGMTQSDAVEAMNEFHQQAVLYAGPETEGKVSLIRPEGETEIFTKFSPGAVGDAYAQVRNKSFRFESLGLVVAPGGHIEAMSYFQTKTAISEGSVDPNTLAELDLKLKMLKWE